MRPASSRSCWARSRFTSIGIAHRDYLNDWDYFVPRWKGSVSMIVHPVIGRGFIVLSKFTDPAARAS
eukprot:4310410-Amphidinium_carterae.1